MQEVSGSIPLSSTKSFLSSMEHPQATGFSLFDTPGHLSPPRTERSHGIGKAPLFDYGCTTRAQGFVGGRVLVILE